MKNSKFSFKRAMALVICLCMVVTSLVFAPVVSAETEIANTNTQEYQYYDIDNTDFSASKTESASAKADDETGNYALRLTKRSSGATAVFGQLDHALEAGKEYSVSFYVKGKSKFFVSFTDNCGYIEGIKAVHVAGNSEKTYDNEEYTKVTLGPVTIPDDGATYNTVRFMGHKEDAGSEFASAVCYIDNITIVENTNTQEYQKYDFDYINPTEKLNESKLYSKFTEDDDNVAIHASTISGTKGYYMGLDHSLEIGKKYKIAFDLKGECKAWIGLAIDTTWNTVIGVPDKKADSYSSPDAYEHYEYEMKAATAEYNTIVFFAQTGTTDFYFDNIVISEECEVTLGAAENGTATLDKTSYYYGDTATLIATPDAGYVFAGWVDAEGNAVADTMKYTFEVAAPVTLTPVFEKAEANTAEYQKYDLDGLTFTDENKKTEGKASVADDGTGNKAIKIEKYKGSSQFYAKPEFALKAGKRYIINMDVKGVNRFWFGITNNFSHADTKGIPDQKEKTHKYDEYTSITFDTGVLAADYDTIRFCSYAPQDWDGSVAVGDVGYIDNIVIEEYPNTQKKQGFDFDKFPLDNPKNEDGTVFSVVTEEDGNKALQVTTPASGTKGYYMQLDFPVEKGKKYKVAFDYKGEEGSFWVGLFDKKGYSNTQKKFPNGGHYFEAKEEYTHYELELTSDTDFEYICLAIMAQKGKAEAGTVYYIDNIVLTEEVDVTVCTADNGTTSADGKTIFYGDTVNLTATGNPAYKFVKWVDETGEDVSYANPYTFVAEGAANITPVFEAYEATEYVRDFDNEDYDAMAPIVASENKTNVEYVYNNDLGKTVAKVTISGSEKKVAIPFIPKDGNEYRVKIKYLYNGVWFCPFYNGTHQNNEGPHNGTANKWVEQDWYFTQEGNDFFYLWSTKIKEDCVIYIDSITFVESTKGDLNNDDAIDAVDITLLRKFIVGDNSNDIDLSAANVSRIYNEDKINIDVKDLVALKKKIATNK